MGGLSQSTQLLAQIKNLILMEEVDVRYLQATVRKQVSMCIVHSLQFTCIFAQVVCTFSQSRSHMYKQDLVHPYIYV